MVSFNNTKLILDLYHVKLNIRLPITDATQTWDTIIHIEKGWCSIDTIFIALHLWLKECHFFNSPNIFNFKNVWQLLIKVAIILFWWEKIN
jgi:hypothetical protein